MIDHVKFIKITILGFKQPMQSTPQSHILALICSDYMLYIDP